jgi:hypothetical protein
MSDWFLVLGPLLLLPIVALLRFVGCGAHISAGPLTVQIVPELVNLTAGQPQQFTAEASYNDAQIVWSVTSPSATSGQITQNGAYTAATTLVASYSEQVTAVASKSGFPDAVAVAIVNLQQGSSAVFLRMDDHLGGTWHDANGTPVYGAEGYVLSHMPPDLPPLPYISPISTPPQIRIWEDPSTLTKSLLKAGATTERYAYAWFDTNSLNFVFNFADTLAHQIAVYCVDWDSQGREQTLTMFDAVNSTMLGPPQPISVYPNGVYLLWRVTGHVRMEVTHSGGGPDAVVSGIFIG